MESPWAVLRCKFADRDDEPYPLEFYQRMFTGRGAGSMNMTDYLAEMSHGQLDLTRSEVFGWYQLPFTLEAYLSDSFPNKRRVLVASARALATAAGVDLTRFFGVAVCLNVPSDLFGLQNGGAAVGGSNNMNPATLAQEFGHAYGLDHSRADGSNADYGDRWDTMSAWDSCFIAEHPESQYVGPGLNAANMRGRGWLDESRVWRDDASEVVEIELRPLHRRDLPGWLAADLGDGYLVEFRAKERWDAAIPRPAVLVHRFRDNHSYILRAAIGTQDGGAGDTFRGPDNVRVTVVSINASRNVARIRIRRRTPFLRRLIVRLATAVLGNVAVDGGGLIIVDGRIIPVPPWDPTARILRAAALFRAAEDGATPEARLAVRNEAVKALAATLQDLQRDDIRVPAPKGN